jgi:YebC/PmpR family DNA-binding regulatory protein
MSGHSKWANTKHRKARADAKRGKIFSKLAKELMVAARLGGGDPDANGALRMLIQKAKSYNMPSDNIDRAIKKGSGDLDSAAMEEILYEGYVSNGIAVLVSVLSDNRNRSVSEVRQVFTKHGGVMAGVGAVAHLFQRKGQIIVPADAVDEERLLELALEAGAEDMQRDGESFEILTEPTGFMAVVDALESASVTPASAELTFLADIEIPVTGLAQAEALMKFMDAMEDLDDVQNVYANFSMDDRIMDALAAAEA